MAETIRAAIGFDLDVDLEVLDEDGHPYAFADDASLDAEVWRGDDESPALTPLVEIRTPGEPGWVRLTAGRADVAGLEPGVYAVRLGVTESGRRLPAWDGFLEVRASPGSGSLPKVYSSEEELLREYDQLRHLNSEFDRTGYLDLRGDVREELIESWVEDYEPIPGFVRTRQTTFDPIFGFDRPDPTRKPPTREQLRAWLVDDRLILTEPIVKAYCKLVVAKVLDRQEVEEPRNGYREHAAMLRSEAMAILHRTPLRIDTSTVADGVPDVEILHDTVTYLGAP